MNLNRYECTLVKHNKGYFRSSTVPIGKRGRSQNMPEKTKITAFVMDETQIQIGSPETWL